MTDFERKVTIEETPAEPKPWDKPEPPKDEPAPEPDVKVEVTEKPAEKDA